LATTASAAALDHERHKLKQARAEDAIGETLRFYMPPRQHHA